MSDLEMIILHLTNMLANVPEENMAASVRELRDILRSAKQDRYDMENS